MKNKTIKSVSIILCALLLITLTSCKPDYSRKFKDYSWRVGERSSHTFTDAIELAVVKGSETDEGACFEMHNPTEHLYQYSAWYAFEIYLDGEWYSMEGCQFDFISMGFLLEPGEMVECNAKGAYGTLAPGKYRIIKDIKRDGDVGDWVYVCAEFTVK